MWALAHRGSHVSRWSARARACVCVCVDASVRVLLMWTIHAGRVIVWGKNVNLQLGTGSLADCALPAVVSFFDPRFDRVTTLCCGAEFTLAATELGRLFGWGSNQYGVFGAHAHAPKYALPVEIAFFRSEAHALVAGVACGAQHTLVLDDTGRVWAAGFNADGQLGVPNQKEYAGFQEVPLRRGSGDCRPVAVFCGREHSGCALDDGSVWVWGFNGAGELGLGTRVNVFEPTRVKLPFAVQRFAGYVCSVWEDDTTTRNAVRRQAMYLQGERSIGLLLLLLLLSLLLLLLLLLLMLLLLLLLLLSFVEEQRVVALM